MGDVTYLRAVAIVSTTGLSWLLLSKYLLLLAILSRFCLCYLLCLFFPWRFAGVGGLLLRCLVDDSLFHIFIRVRIFMNFFLASLLCGCRIFIAWYALWLILCCLRLNLLLWQII